MGRGGYKKPFFLLQSLICPSKIFKLVYSNYFNVNVIQKYQVVSNQKRLILYAYYKNSYLEIRKSNFYVYYVKKFTPFCSFRIYICFLLKSLVFISFDRVKMKKKCMFLKENFQCNKTGWNMFCRPAQEKGLENQKSGSKKIN